MGVTIVEDEFGEAVDPFTKEKRSVQRFTFINGVGVEVQVITLGATITALKIPDDKGKKIDIVLGFDDVAGYQSVENPYFGATVGRVCNRIAYGKFVLGNEEIHLSKNFKKLHHLHGGFVGLDKVIWDAEMEDDAIAMRHQSDYGHEGYPGILSIKVIFRLTECNEFSITFRACSSDPTPVNLTNHAYFNLAGHDAGRTGLLDHILKIKADRITVTDESSIPTGDFKYVERTPYDFRAMNPLSDRISVLWDKGALGFDDNYCTILDPNKDITLVAKAIHATSGRWLEVLSNQPGLQFYTSNYFPDKEKGEEPINGKEKAQYYKHAAFCLESQKYPDAVNHPNFPSTIVNPGEPYYHKLVYKFGMCIENRELCKTKEEGLSDKCPAPAHVRKCPPTNETDDNEVTKEAADDLIDDSYYIDLESIGLKGDKALR